MEKVWFVLFINVGSIIGFKLEKLENDLLKHIDVEALQDVFKVHLYRNPHPKCGLLDESCDFDNNCCQGLECKMDVDRIGLKSVCLSKVVDSNDIPQDYDTDDDLGWSFTKPEDIDDPTDVQGDAVRAQLNAFKEKEKQALNSDVNLIQELRKPLTFEELRELTQLKELDGLKRQQELKELKEWTENHKANERLKQERQKLLEKIAKERVEQVLKEEERQKMEMFKEMLAKGKQE